MLIYIFKFLRIKLIKQIKLVMIEDDIQIVYLKNLVYCFSKIVEYKFNEIYNILFIIDKYIEIVF